MNATGHDHGRRAYVRWRRDVTSWEDRTTFVPTSYLEQGAYFPELAHGPPVSLSRTDDCRALTGKFGCGRDITEEPAGVAATGLKARTDRLHNAAESDGKRATTVDRLAIRWMLIFGRLALPRANGHEVQTPRDHA